MMTSATGNPAPAGGLRGSRSGFTLVEIIVVMAIIVTLFALIALGLGAVMGRAAEKATGALITRMKSDLDAYKSLLGSYPPDGLDSPEKNDQGEIIRGSACLYHYLTKPLVIPEKNAGQVRKIEHPPISKFADRELSKEDPDHPGVREILDGWKVPIHYDNVEDGEFHSQRGEVHFPEVDDEEHPADPRDGTVEVDGKPVVEKAGIQGKGYDIWSHAELGHTKKGACMPIATWNLRE
jgi:prepilin-type N-terminal cleavage/methylation domain-containing protein